MQAGTLFIGLLVLGGFLHGLSGFLREGSGFIARSCDILGDVGGAPSSSVGPL